jgi:hypothetical protein
MVVYDEMGGIPETLCSGRVSDGAQKRPAVRFYSSRASGSCHILGPMIEAFAEAHADCIDLQRIEAEDEHLKTENEHLKDEIDRIPTLIFSIGNTEVDRIEGPAGRMRIALGFTSLKQRAETWECTQPLSLQEQNTSG